MTTDQSVSPGPGQGPAEREPLGAGTIDGNTSATETGGRSGNPVASLAGRTRAKDPLFGLFCCSTSVQNVEVLAGSGADFLIFDHEHGPWSWPDFHAQLAALAGSGVAAVVRVAEATPVNARVLLDLGVDAVMVANVETATQAADAVRSMRYPPRGVRGMGGSVRATAYGRQRPSREEADGKTALWVQIESRRALGNAVEIAEVPGVDAVFFGPHDLAVDLGYFGDPRHPEVVAALRRGMAAVLGTGRAAGLLAAPDQVAEWRAAGATVIASGSDLGLLAQAADRLVAQCRVPREVLP
ncbi:MAG: aldolase/citrate lyase family protein [Pigmentiphaga sp.]|nr:aldolase/citrate lyase family protein [Pigmentiphaga sp.]